MELTDLSSKIGTASSVANTIVEAGHAIVEPFIDIANGASQLIGMFI